MLALPTQAWEGHHLGVGTVPLEGVRVGVVGLGEVFSSTTVRAILAEQCLMEPLSYQHQGGRRTRGLLGRGHDMWGWPATTRAPPVCGVTR